LASLVSDLSTFVEDCLKKMFELHESEIVSAAFVCICWGFLSVSNWEELSPTSTNSHIQVHTYQLYSVVPYVAAAHRMVPRPAGRGGSPTASECTLKSWNLEAMPPRAAGA
jgi:hypothetical protein